MLRSLHMANSPPPFKRFFPSDRRGYQQPVQPYAEPPGGVAVIKGGKTALSSNDSARKTSYYFYTGSNMCLSIDPEKVSNEGR
jgi:hypothetical protein